MGRGGTVLGIIGILLGAGALGFAFVVWNGQNTPNNLTSSIFVGIWDDLDDNQDFAPYEYQNDWLFEFLDNKLNNTDYISVSNTNTRITLLTSGWYRIHLSALLSGISPSRVYSISLFKDGAMESYLDYFGTLAASVFSYHNIDSSVLVYSNGANYIEINGFSSDDFQIYVDIFNQLTIEYVAT